MPNTREIIKKFYEEVNRRRRFDVDYDFTKLNNGKLEDSDIELLCEGLKNISAQKKLDVDLSNNRIGSKGILAITGWLRSGFLPPVVTLRLDGIDLSLGKIEKLNQAAQVARAADHDVQLYISPGPGN